MLGNWCIEMFYNKFCSIVSCSVIKVVIEEPSCTGSGKQCFKNLEGTVRVHYVCTIRVQNPTLHGRHACNVCNIWRRLSVVTRKQFGPPIYTHDTCYTSCTGLLCVNGNTRLVVFRWKVTFEIQDGWRKDAERIKMSKNTCDKFWFSFFYNTFFPMNVNM